MQFFCGAAWRIKGNRTRQQNPSLAARVLGLGSVLRLILSELRSNLVTCRSANLFDSRSKCDLSTEVTHYNTVEDSTQSSLEMLTTAPFCVVLVCVIWLFCLLVVFVRLSVSVQVTDWKDSSLK